MKVEISKQTQVKCMRWADRVKAEGNWQLFELLSSILGAYQDACPHLEEDQRHVRHLGLTFCSTCNKKLDDKVGGKL